MGMRWRVMGLRGCLVLAAACLAGSWSAGQSAAGTGAPAAFVYAHDNANPNTVLGFRVDAGGALDPLPGSPFATGNGALPFPGSCGTAAYSARRRLLFTTGGAGVSVFRVQQDGTLELVPGSPFGQAAMLGVTAAEVGRDTVVYAGEPDSALIRIFHVEEDGTLREDRAPTAVGATAGLAAGRGLLFFTLNGGRIVACRIRRDGSLVALRGFPLSLPGAVLQQVALDPAGRCLYAADRDSPRLFGFKTHARRGLVALRGSPFAVPGLAGGVGGVALAGTRLLATYSPSGAGVGDVQPFARSRKGLLAPLGPGRDSGLPAASAGALDVSGRILVLADDRSDQVRSFTLDGVTGALAPADAESAPMGDGGVSSLLIVQQ